MANDATKRLEREIQEVVDQLVSNYRPEKVILFGSAARGDATEESDMDLLVIKEGVDGIPRHQRHYEVNKLFRSRVATDVLVYTQREINKRLYLGDPFIKHIIREGRVVYGA